MMRHGESFCTGAAYKQFVTREETHPIQGQSHRKNEREREIKEELE
jgi:hypothetical protein